MQQILILTLFSEKIRRYVDIDCVIYLKLHTHNENLITKQVNGKINLVSIS